MTAPEASSTMPPDPTTPRVPIVAVAAAGSLVALVLLLVVGVSPAGDTPRYLDGARALLAGEPLPGKANSYVGYVLVVGFFEVTGLGTTGVVVFQALAVGLATWAVGLTAAELAGHRAGLLAAGLVAVNLDVHAWHTYVLPDSLYLTSLAGCVWALARAGARGGTGRVAIAVALLLAVAAIRPNGLLLLPVGLAWLVGCRLASHGRAAATAGVAVTLIGAALVAVPLAANAGAAESPIQMLADGVVVGSATGVQTPMPEPSRGPLHDGSDVAAYVTDHPGAVARLATLRVVYQLTHVRPFYPVPLNVARLGIVTLLLGFAAVAVGHDVRSPVVWLIGATVTTHLLVVALTFADREGRFLLHLIPLISILAGVGAASVLRRWEEHRTLPAGDDSPSLVLRRPADRP